MTRYRPVIGLLILTILGILGNLLSVPLFFGVDVIFGSVATLLAVCVYGVRWGVLSSFIAASYTFILWNHPYAAIIFTAEALFVGLTAPWFRSNLALASAAYWATLGMLQVYVYYRFGLEMDQVGTLLVVTKQATNGIFNAILAGLILDYTPLLKLLTGRDKPRTPVFQNIFNVFVAAALIPASILVVIDARGALSRVEQDAIYRLETISTGISISLERWLRQHVRAISSVARLIEKNQMYEPKKLQALVENNSAVWPAFLGTYIADHKGTTIAFDPLVNARGDSTIGINFSDRDYFRVLRSGEKSPYISTVFLARGGVFEPVFNIAARIQRNGEFFGIAAGSLNLKQLNVILNYLPGESGYLATLVDRAGNVITSTDPNFVTLENYRNAVQGNIRPIEQNYYYRVPDDTIESPMTKWNKSFIGREARIPGEDGWVLNIELPLKELRLILYQRYIANMGFMLGLVVVILFGSMGMAGKISKPLIELSRETTDIPERIEHKEVIQWPKSNLVEVDLLIKNFRSTVDALKKRFADIEASRVQLKKSKDEAEAANRLKSSFLANMSHEIRTPLGVMIGFSELMSEDGVTPQERKKYAETLKRNGEQLSILIDDILDLSKVEAGYLTIETIRLSLRRTIQEVLLDFQAKAQEKNIKLACSIPDGTEDELLTDPVRLKQILANLIGNSIKFTPQGHITLKVLRNDHELEVEVEDSGVGIELEDQSKLFQPFTQADESMTRRFGGTGLGLALSKRLSVLLGGDLTLKWSSPGKGSIFSLTIKNHKYDLSPVSSSGSVATNESLQNINLTGMRLLLVEDSVDNQYLVATILGKNGIIVEFADHGADGVKKALANDYDAVIMDLQMPVMDGYTATEKLRASGYQKPIIALSAHAMSDIRQRCIEAGFTDHLPKPIVFHDLLAVLLKVTRS